MTQLPQVVPYDAAPPSADSLWDAEEAAAWAPAEELNVPEWSEKHRELTKRQSSRPGRWMNANQPGLVGLMLLATHREVRELWIKKSAQFGASEGVRNVIARCAHLDPKPVMLVLPDEQSGRKIVRKRVIPLFEDTEVLRALLTGNTKDKKLTSVLLTNGFELSLAWAGSPSAMASDPYALVILDEVDKYSAAGLQVDPVYEARVRLRTYKEQGSLLIALSTPSTPLGPIAVGYDDCQVKLAYYCHCPHCGTPQRAAFDRLKWEKFADLPDAKSRAARVKARAAAWVECSNPQCATMHPAGEGKILERHRRAMLIGGFWATEDLGWRIYTDGSEEGEKPEGGKVGMHIHALIDLSVSLADIAAEYIECDGRPEQLKGFFNLWLGEDFKDPVAILTTSIFRSKCLPDPDTGSVPFPQQILPPWVSRILVTVDTQKDHFWFVVRAYGYAMRSQRIHHGRAGSFEELEDLFERREWRYQHDCFPPLRAYKLGIDSGGGVDSLNRDASRTEQVYQWCNRNPLYRLALKGASKALEPPGVRMRDRTYAPIDNRKAPFPIRLYLIDGANFRDQLSHQFTAEVQVPDAETGELLSVPQWSLNDSNDDEHYNRHLSNMLKTRVKSGKAFVDRWIPKTAGARHDLHDCETYQMAMAIGMGLCVALPTPRSIIRQQQHLQAAITTPPPRSGMGGGFRAPDGRAFLAPRR
ncbi:MAG TPA: terminase gpA endonuclease subunit [Tepidisphaeraceae bacterium]|jgi:phage terminase large subunit GpA-like protein|nr:terminase gpA endonuclease subunit [Tepidisphaeraceae bacterium]